MSDLVGNPEAQFSHATAHIRICGIVISKATCLINLGHKVLPQSFEIQNCGLSPYNCG